MTLLVMWFLSAWAATLPETVDDAMAFAATDRVRAAKLLENALAQGVLGRDADVITVYAGEQRRLLGEAPAARRWFKEVSPDSAWASAARLGLLLTDNPSRLSESARAALAGFQSAAILPSQDADRHALLAIDAAVRGQADRSGEHAALALAAARSDANVLARIQTALQSLAGPSRAPSAADGSLMVRAEEALAAGRIDEARRLAEQVIASDATATDVAAARYLLRRVTASPVDANRIAILLPLSGKYEAVGRQILDALQDGFADVGGDRKFVIIDSGGTAEAAVAGIERAALQDGAIAVVGPLLSDEIPGVVQAADALRIPLVSLAQSLETAADHPWVLQGLPTRGAQAEALVSHVVHQRNWTRFAVFAPDNAYGHSAADAFAGAVGRAGGTVAATAWFKPDATDLVPDATRLRKLATERDFDAMFIPQNAKDLPFACAALAVTEFPMGEYLPIKDKSPYRALLGLSTWNNASLLTNGGPYVRSGLFVDVFSALAPGDHAPFVERYKAAHSRTPTSLEASAWDVGRLLGTAAKTDAGTRDAFLAALMSAQVDGSVTGADHIDARTHTVTAEIKVYTITRHGFDIVAPTTDPIEE